MICWLEDLLTEVEEDKHVAVVLFDSDANVVTCYVQSDGYERPPPGPCPASGRAEALRRRQPVGVDDLIFSVVDGGSAEARWAMTQYFEELAQRFPGGFVPGGALDVAATRYNLPTGLFVIARVAGEPVGCGALDFIDDTSAEIKRMWISTGIRGIGLGKRLLAHLEDQARRAGRSRVVLDTNGSLTEAIAMYQAAGYAATDRYNDNPYAEHWFTKTLRELERP